VYPCREVTHTERVGRQSEWKAEHGRGSFFAGRRLTRGARLAASSGVPVTCTTDQAPSSLDSFFAADAEALVNTVNCVGVMGKGLALQFKRRFPANFEAYAAACLRGEVKIGSMCVFAGPRDRGGQSPRFIINFPTKRHWREPSRIEYVRDGLIAMIKEIRARDIRSVAVPPLGCGNGGLSWDEVKPMIERAATTLPGVRVLMFSPDSMRHSVCSASGAKASAPLTQLALPLIETPHRASS
jgi:O-acetyl-ADP-ribose deacetylase (regulator of RNase III)